MSNTEQRKMLVVQIEEKQVGIPLWRGEKGAKGVALYAWNADLTNIASIAGMEVGDYVVNTGTAPRMILGITAAIGDVIKSTSATAGMAAGNIRGAAGAPGANGTPGQDFSNVYITKILDISTDGKTGTVQCLDGSGEATGAIFEDVTMLGSITAIGGIAVVNMGESAWSLRSTPADNKWLSVCHGNGRFVAVSSDGTHRVMTSTDGREWTLCNTSSVTNGAAWQSVCFGGGVFVAVASSGTNRVMVSTDGLNWTSYKAAAQNSWQSVCFGNNRFVAVASDGTHRVMVSANNGQSWTAVKAAAQNPWRSVCFGNGKFLAVASSGTTQVMVSNNDGATWVGYKPSAARAYRSVCFGEGKFVAVSSGSKSYHCMVSENDGVTWTSYTMPNLDWQSVCYGEGLWVSVANSGRTARVLVADDGHSWTRKLVPKNLNWQSVCYGDGIFVGVAASGKGDRAMSSEPTSFNINYGFVGQYALVVEFEGTKFAVLQGGSLTGDPVEDEEQKEDDGLLDETTDFGALIETHNDDADAHAGLFTAVQERIEEHLEDEEAHQQLFDTKQNKITSTGQANLLTAPSTVGGQPGTKPISDFATSAQGAKADTAYQKPTTGIPKTDLAAAVQTSLNKADSALQSFTETDPTVPAWAKSATKPTYTASEVGAAAAGHTHNDKQNALNRTVGGNDNATGTVTDTGGNLSVPIPVTVVAPAASPTQITAGTRSLRATFKLLIDNIANLFSRMGTAETNIDGKQNTVTGKTLSNALQKITTDSQGHLGHCASGTRCIRDLSLCI